MASRPDRAIEPRPSTASTAELKGIDMKAVCWYGKGDIRVQDVPEPKILNPRDAILQVTTTALRGSDLHLFNGVIPTMLPCGLRDRSRRATARPPSRSGGNRQRRP